MNDNIENSMKEETHQLTSREIEKSNPIATDLTESQLDRTKLLRELETQQQELELQFKKLQMAEDNDARYSDNFSSLYNLAPAAYFTFDVHGIVRELNQSGAELLGSEHLYLKNRNFRQFVGTLSIQVFDSFLKKILETGTKQSCEIQLNVSGNSIKYVHLVGTVFNNYHDCLVIAVDITRQKLAEIKLKDSESRYRSLFEQAMDGILIVDADTGQIIDANPYLLGLTGYNFNELNGKRFWEIGIFKNILASEVEFIDMQNKKCIHFEEARLKTKNNLDIDVEFVSNVYVVGQIKVVQCNFRDITERKKAQEQLKKSEAHLRKLNATKDKFFSIISHDLRSPFSSIIGYSDILVRQVREKNFEAIEEYAEIIQNSSWRAMDLLTNLIEWSVSQAGKMEFNPKKIQITKVINEVIDLLNDSARQKLITIIKKIPQENVDIVADEAMVSAIFRNLISNAIKFTHRGGTIIISIQKNEKEMLAAISDNGVGMKKATIEKLFRIEGSISMPGTQQEKGTGLGLLLCKEFVEKHGGNIWVESELCKGSMFLFTIPAV